MNLLNGQSRYAIAAIMLALSMLVAALLPLVTAAAQLNQRSVSLSSSSKAATGVEYEVKFTSTTAAQSVVIDFCSNTPLIGESCTKPSGLSLAGTITSTGGTVTKDDANGILTIDRVITAGENTFSVVGITNPDVAETMYLRIMTFALATDADAYTSVVPGAVVDSGSVAVAITNTVGVAGAVLETLTFCVAKTTGDVAIEDDCANANTPGNEPVLTLGEDVGGGVIALTPGEISSGVLQTQISTNAAGGAVVRLKSEAAGCGGLMRLGSDAIAQRCLEPATAHALTGTAAIEFFGVSTNVASANGSFGLVQPSAGYNSTDFNLGYDAANATGVTSILGDPFLNTNNAPTANANMGITFGAAATNQTASGVYATDLRLIATGTF